MSALIEIEIPQNCMECPFPSVGTDFYYCYAQGGRAYTFDKAETVPSDCPLREVTRCEDCCFFIVNESYSWCRRTKCPTSKDGFCNFGRRENVTGI